MAGSIFTKSKLTQSSVKHDIGSAFAWHYAQVGSMMRDIAARSAGLDAQKYSELPPGISVVNFEQQGSDSTPIVQPGVSTSTVPPPSLPIIQKGVGMLPAIGAIAGGSVITGLLTALLLHNPTPNAPRIQTRPMATVPAQIVPAAKPGYWRAEQYQVQPDGTEKVIGAVHYRDINGIVEQLGTDGVWKPVAK